MQWPHLLRVHASIKTKHSLVSGLVRAPMLNDASVAMNFKQGAGANDVPSAVDLDIEMRKRSHSSQANMNLL